MFFRPYPTNIFVAPQKPLTAQCSSKLKNSAVAHDKFYVTLVIGISGKTEINGVLVFFLQYALTLKTEIIVLNYY